MSPTYSIISNFPHVVIEFWRGGVKGSAGVAAVFEGNVFASLMFSVFLCTPLSDPIYLQFPLPLLSFLFSFSCCLSLTTTWTAPSGFLSDGLPLYAFENKHYTKYMNNIIISAVKAWNVAPVMADYGMHFGHFPNKGDGIPPQNAYWIDIYYWSVHYDMWFTDFCLHLSPYFVVAFWLRLQRGYRHL